MEDEAQHPSNPTPDQTLDDPTIHQKHASMLERLSNLHQTRLQNSLTRKSDSHSSNPSFESTQSFLSRFSDSKRSIESQLAGCRLTTATTDPNSLKSQLEAVAISIAELEKLVAENSYFLPSYEVRSSLKSISDLKQTLENLNSELIPKKKFAFRNKAAKKDQSSAAKGAAIVKPDPHLINKTSFEVRDSPGFRNKEGQVLVKDFKGLEVGEFALSDLNSCEVKLMGCARALFVHRLQNCRVYAGPILGSILIEEVEGCVFVLASHQIRIHHAKGSDFYLRVRSRPIIEDCSRVRFAPYCLCYKGIEEDLRESSLNEEMGNWANVDDFRWLRAVQSPNWSILPENERVGTIEISNSETGIEES
ncbi:hypothetical protein L1049_002395 [Liquidambar formosana]|uniref:C-CAP/cofactor C-like domain-containing protein n=1 Tax=Liquidambar formosana TaxID=63359 RepID=A0AAP0R9A3_LIQFO